MNNPDMPMDDVLDLLKRVEESRQRVFDVLEKHGVPIHSLLCMDIDKALQDLWLVTHKRLPGEEDDSMMGYYLDGFSYIFGEDDLEYAYR